MAIFQEQTGGASIIVWLETLRAGYPDRISALAAHAIGNWDRSRFRLALSVGATAVVFHGSQDGHCSGRCPFTRPAELVQLRTDFAGAGQSKSDWIFWNDTQEIIRRTRTFKSVGVYRNAVFDLGGGAYRRPKRCTVSACLPACFGRLGVSPMLGRNILPEEDQARARRMR